MKDDHMQISQFNGEISVQEIGTNGNQREWG